MAEGRQAREARLAAALRENLRRRKAAASPLRENPVREHGAELDAGPSGNGDADERGADEVAGQAGRPETSRG